MRGFDVTNIGSRARMSQSDSQDVIFITVGQEKRSTNYFRHTFLPCKSFLRKPLQANPTEIYKVARGQ